MSIKILPYKRISISALALARSIPNARKLRLDRQGSLVAYVPRRNHTVINWGNSTEEAKQIQGRVGRFLNKAEAVALAVNKLDFYNKCKELSVPEFTTDKTVAEGWIRDGNIVVARITLNGRGGRGIVLARKLKELPAARLYTKYQPKKSEFRIHVLGDKVIDCQQKKKKNGFDNANFQVRSHENGWVFCREGVKPPEKVKKLAIDAVKALGLDFGAADIGWTVANKLAVCYEVNTAPGLEGTTLERYSSNLKEYIAK